MPTPRYPDIIHVFDIVLGEGRPVRVRFNTKSEADSWRTRAYRARKYAVEMQKMLQYNWIKIAAAKTDDPEDTAFAFIISRHQTPQLEIMETEYDPIMDETPLPESREPNAPSRAVVDFDFEALARNLDLPDFEVE